MMLKNYAKNMAKYIKLKGDEVPTERNKTIADLYLEWFAASRKHITRYINLPLDEDVLHDTILGVYNSIALKGYYPKNFLGLTLMSYRNEYNRAYNKSGKTRSAVSERTFYIVFCNEIDEGYTEKPAVTPEDVTKYIADTYDVTTRLLWETYAAAYPCASYDYLAETFGLDLREIRAILSEVKKDIRNVFFIR